MTTATQQIPSNPARDFANAILAEFNNGLELIEILHDIAQGKDEKATENDRIAANNILLDRGLGKCPKQSLATNPDPAPDTDVGAIRESPAAAHSEPESPRLVTQIDQSLHDSLGPAPNAQPQDAADAAKSSESPEPLDPFSIQATIQRHILTITNNGLTLLASLAEIARAQDDPKACPERSRRIKTSHRRRAAKILIDRLAGTDPNAVRNAVCPDCRRKWTAHSGSHTHPYPGEAEAEDRDKDAYSKEVWDSIIAELKQKEEAGILTPDPNAPKGDYSRYFPPKDFDMTPYADEGAAKFRADNALRLERRKQWPAIEERRRKKLAQIYPSHSEDSEDEPPDT